MWSHKFFFGIEEVKNTTMKISQPVLCSLIWAVSIASCNADDASSIVKNESNEDNVISSSSSSLRGIDNDSKDRKLATLSSVFGGLYASRPTTSFSFFSPYIHPPPPASPPTTPYVHPPPPVYVPTPPPPPVSPPTEPYVPPPPPPTTPWFPWFWFQRSPYVPPPPPPFPPPVQPLVCATLPTDNYYNLIAKHSNMALNVEGQSLNNGASLIQWPVASSKNDNFRFESLGNGYYQIIAEHSKKVINGKL